jgi:hypothetical protein
VIEGVSNPIAYGLAVVCFGGWILVWRMVWLISTGKWHTDPEFRAMEKRAEFSEGAMRIRDEQLNAALGVLPQVASVLEKFHVAGEQVRQEREDSG